MNLKQLKKLKRQNICLYCGEKVPLLSDQGFCLMCLSKLEVDYVD